MSDERYVRRRRRRCRNPLLVLLLFLVILVAAVIACVAAFGGGQDTSSNEVEIIDPIKPDENQDGENGEDDSVQTDKINPLTGLAVDNDISQKRPYVVMINNIKVATPQSGISKADIIFETLAEGGLTRLMAVYQDIENIGIVGSVRSARPYFIDIAMGLDAIFVHAGGSDDAYITIKDRDVDNIDGVHGSGETFFRDQWRQKNMGYEHSLMLDTSLLDAYCQEHDLRTEHNSGFEVGMNFADDPALPAASQANNIDVTFSGAKSTQFAFQSDSGEYIVSQYGSNMKDSVDGSSVSVRNLLVLKAPVSPIPGDTEGRVQETLVGSGKGYFFYNGQMTEITWSKESYSSPFKYSYSDGSQIEFGRGKTYICIIPDTGDNIEIS